MSHHVLVIDDDPSMCQLLGKGLTREGLAVHVAASAQEGFTILGEQEIDVVVTDVRMRRVDGIELCRRVAESRPDVPVIVITAFGSMETAIDAMRAGAYDFLAKPFDLDAARLAVARAINHRELSQKVARLELELEATRQPDDMLGTSPSMQRVYDLIDRVAPSDAAVLVTGESGTGKELVARALHARSPRKSGPFVAVNCAALPETLLESELFGHTKGAFTDAKTARAGLFQQAQGGTLFLDEVGEIPIALQPKLLRALQEKSVRPVGGSVELPVDVRVVTATNVDLETAVEEGRFRQDLFYRIQVIQIDLPPLRARGNDILLLAQHFLSRYAAASGKEINGFLPAAAEKLLAYSWPGNVRELQNCIERAVTLCRYSEITVDDLPDKIRDFRQTHWVIAGDDPADFVPMEEIERRYVLRVFEATGENKALAAKILGFNRKTLYRKLRRYGAIPPEGTPDDSSEGG